jgi:hypothetical protein
MKKGAFPSPELIEREKRQVLGKEYKITSLYKARKSDGLTYAE